MDLDALRTGPIRDLRDPAPLVSRETAFSGRVWDIDRDVAVFGDGTITREYMAHSGAVAVLARDDDDRILLINQYRQPTGTRHWELPAGLLDIPGEEPLAAAQRELAEEVDLVAAEWSPLTRYFSSPGGSNEVIILFEARGLTAAPAAHARTEEEAEIVVRWVPLDEVVEAILRGGIGNAPLIVAALTAHARR